MGVGKKEKCMEKENILGLMAEFMKVIIFKIKNKVKEFIFGLMDGNTTDIGKMGNNTDKENY